nr:MAG TPA: hypothetical protein [Caudoviricetes sp.]
MALTFSPQSASIWPIGVFVAFARCLMLNASSCALYIEIPQKYCVDCEFSSYCMKILDNQAIA